jgi:hypothetical protein
VVAVHQASASAPDAEVIAEMRHHIEKAVTNGAVPARKALLQPLITGCATHSLGSHVWAGYDGSLVAIITTR